MKQTKYEVNLFDEEIDLGLLVREQDAIVCLVSWSSYDGAYQMVALVTDRGAKAAKEVGMDYDTHTYTQVDKSGKLDRATTAWSGGGYVLCSTRGQLRPDGVAAAAADFITEYNARKKGVVEVHLREWGEEE